MNPLLRQWMRTEISHNALDRNLGEFLVRTLRLQNVFPLQAGKGLKHSNRALG